MFTAERVKLCVVPVGFLDLVLFMCMCVLVWMYATYVHEHTEAIRVCWHLRQWESLDIGAGN